MEYLQGKIILCLICLFKTLNMLVFSNPRPVVLETRISLHEYAACCIFVKIRVSRTTGRGLSYYFACPELVEG